MYMLRCYLFLFFGVITASSSAYSLEFIELKNKETFEAKVVGKTWLHAAVDATLRIEPDGSMTADAPKGKLVGKWEFINGKGFCREATFAGKKLPYACQKVKMFGDRILVVFSKKVPNGDPFILFKD